jgi:hypothetical protein
METKVNELNENLKNVMVLATEVAKNKKYVIKVDGEEQSHLEFINFKIDHLTQSGRKKLARRIFIINKKRGQKSFNNFFWYLKLKNIIDFKVVLETSQKEKQIQIYRKEYVNLRKQVEEARLKYIEEKGDFYKS